MRRLPQNPLITPEEVKPSTEGMEVVCAFNPGVTRFNGEVLLLLRVAERPVNEPGYIQVPVLDLESEERGIKILRFKRDDPDLDTSDPRAIVYKGRVYLSSMSHLRLARSRDGINFVVDDKPALFPTEPYEEYGIEDPRITRLDGTYYITYVAVSSRGIATALASTKDFVHFEKHGIIFPPENRDVAIFPERTRGGFVTLHRPVPRYIGQPSMWLAYSPDLINWDKHLFLMAPREDKWDSQRIGAGAVPIKTEKGWLEIYHGVSPQWGYCLGAVLLDLEEPERVIARSPRPLLIPEVEYEKEGFYQKVVFTCGALAEPDGRLRIYYGAADKVVACVETSVDEILEGLEPERI